MKLAQLDLPEGNAIRAPGEAPSLMALEIAMDEMAEKLGMDPVEFRIRNDTQVDPSNLDRPFSQRHLVQCLRDGAERFGWSKRNATPGKMRDGRWLVGMGVAAGIRNNLLTKSAARVRLERDGTVTVETDMTDIGTGSYTIIAQTAAEMMGVRLEQRNVRQGDLNFPVSAGSGEQWGANNATSGVFAAYAKLHENVARKLGFNSEDARFEGGRVHAGKRDAALVKATQDGPLSADYQVEYGGLGKKYHHSTFAPHYVEVGVDRFTGETRIRRILAVCEAGCTINLKSARSQVIGAVVIRVGAALMGELAVNTERGFFVNHDLASYEVPVHADIPHQEVVFRHTPDPMSSPMKAKGVGELSLYSVGAAIANAIYNVTDTRIRAYSVTLDKLLYRLPAVG